MGEELARRLRVLAAACLAAALNAFAQVAPANAIDLGLAAPAAAAAFRLEDRRPAAERETREERVFNLWVVAVGDALLQPPPPEALLRWLQRRPGPELAGAGIELEALTAELELQDTSVDFRAVGVQGAGLVANLLGNLIAKSALEGAAAGRTDNILRFHASGRVNGVPFRADLTRRYRGRAFGGDFIEAFTAGLEETGAAIRRAAAPASAE